MQNSGQLELIPVVEIAQKDQERFWSKVAVGADDECWEWQASKDRKGYGQIDIRAGNIKRRNIKTHRLAWMLTYGLIPDGLMVCHSCDTPACVNPSHLFLGSNRDNMLDAKAKGRVASGERSGRRTHPERFPHGEQSPNAKLDDEKVKLARARHHAGESMRSLARMFGVDHKTLRRAIIGDTWKHVP